MNSKDGYRKQMITYKERDPEWESSLILTKGVGTDWLQADCRLILIDTTSITVFNEVLKG